MCQRREAAAADHRPRHSVCPPRPLRGCLSLLRPTAALARPAHNFGISTTKNRRIPHKLRSLTIRHHPRTATRLGPCALAGIAQVERIQLGGSLNLTANCECLQVEPVNASEVTTMGDGAEVPPSGVRGPVGEGGRMRRNPRKEENGRRRRRSGIECLILPSE